jgi:RNA polymerase sigma-70 factor (ECF subfamily)
VIEELNAGTFIPEDALRDMNIGEIVQRCKNGDYEAWNMIVDRYAKTVYNLALNFFNNREDAEDITQDIFLKVYNNIEKFREDKSFNSWLVKISTNYCIDHWRKSKRSARRVELSDDLIKTDHTPEDRAVKDHDVMNLRNKMSHLDPDLRLLLIMRDIQDHSYKEIATTLNLPLGTIKSRINRARIKLAKTFMDEEH